MLTLVLIAAAALLYGPLAAAGQEDGWFDRAPAVPITAAVLGTHAPYFRTVNTIYRDVAPAAHDDAGVRSLGFDKRGGALLCPAAFTAGNEIVFTWRFAGEGKAYQHISADLGLVAASDRAEKDKPRLSFTHRPGDPFVRWHLGRLPGLPERGRSGAYRLRAIEQAPLGWPDIQRQLLEHELAAIPAASEVWFTARIAHHGDRIRFSFQDRLIAERPWDEAQRAGQFRIVLSGDVRLHSLRVLPLADTGRFECVRLGTYRNSAELAGQRLRPDSLPAAGQVTRVNNVPFCFAGPDAAGRDHVDIGVSWFRTGALAGHFPSNRGGVGGRWQGALSPSRTRLQFRVPNGRYQVLHAIAASDDAKDAFRGLSVQFYRPGAGFPFHRQAVVPAFAEKNAPGALAVVTERGRTRYLHHIQIPLNPGDFSAFSDRDAVEFELTKDISLFRAYPDPFHYSYHQAGLPSAAHVYAVTLERAPFEAALKTDGFYHVWTAPKRPAYTLLLHNTAAQMKTFTLSWQATAFEQAPPEPRSQAVKLGPGQKRSVPIRPAVKRHGHYDLTVSVSDDVTNWTESRSFVWLAKDTRTRGGWQRGDGPIWGFWNWRGGHGTPSGADQSQIMAMAGCESRSGSLHHAKDDEKAVARKWKMTTFKHFYGGDHYVTNDLRKSLKTAPEAEAVATMIEKLKKFETPATDITRPEIISFFPEPHIGSFTHSNVPMFSGREPYVMTESEQEKFQEYLDAFVIGARAVKKHFPQAKAMLPHGDPTFCVPFVRHSQEARELMDGITVDIPVFERLPEHQLHQVVLHRMYICRDELNKAGLTDPLLPMYEGPCLPDHEGALSQRALADQTVRCSLILIGYGVVRQLGGQSPFQCSNYWGEQHYGGGLFNPLPVAAPKPVYAAFATMTRHLNRAEFDGWSDTGSRSTYAMRFKHVKTGKYIHVLWCIRGTRMLSADIPPGGRPVAYDLMDNVVAAPVRKGRAEIAVSSSPVFVHGLGRSLSAELGKAVHDDAGPGPHAQRISRLVNWHLTPERDVRYETNSAWHIQRSFGEMSTGIRPVPEAYGRMALSLTLNETSNEPRLMPFYRILRPARPVRVPGKASHLGLWVKASSDWGRVIYFVVDAKGEKWMSVGKREQWNADDTHNRSVFCFDGWRYLTFEMPASSPYDQFREAGTTWWGNNDGPGDGVVDLPLTLEKIAVERRTHVLYVNEAQPASPEAVLFGDLFAEYAQAEDASAELSAQSRLQMPVPDSLPALGNPLTELRRSGVGIGPTITAVRHPDHHADGTQCHVDFTVQADDQSVYDVWVSPYRDGRGAMKLGRGWKGAGDRVRGLRPETDFYAFVVRVKEDGKTSKPGPPFHIRLKDNFAMK
jgi:hypothetical protein